MNKLITHIKVWNRWRKKSGNPWDHKLCVLLKLANSPTFELEYSMYKFRAALFSLSDSVKITAKNLSKLSDELKENGNG